MPFNRIFWGHQWPAAPTGEVDYPNDRLPPYQDSAFPAFLQTSTGAIDFAALAGLPTLFLEEGTSARQTARVGSVQVLSRGRETARLRYSYDQAVPPLAQDRLLSVAGELGLSTSGRRWEWDWGHSWWAVRDGDLYQTMIRLVANTGNSPTVFSVSSPPRIDPLQVSAMMSFDASFTPVYSAISDAAAAVGARCNRADNVWDHDVLVQDIASLIDRSRIIVCDLSGRNPNVFYETGVAHALGRQTILITQRGEDIPFDLRHHRYIPYLNNGEGRAALTETLTGRMRTILA